MEKVTCKFTVLFENPFWTGLFERKEGRNLFVSKVIFGAEPKEYDVYEFVQRNYYDLEFSPAVKVHAKKSARNPKRRQRETHRQMEDVGIGTKSQQAFLQLKQEYTNIRLVHLYTLEGAICNTEFNCLSEEKKKELKGFSDFLK